MSIEEKHELLRDLNTAVSERWRIACSVMDSMLEESMKEEIMDAVISQLEGVIDWLENELELLK